MADAAGIRRVAVIGAGTMGAGIAGEFARLGCDVWMVDMNPLLLRRGMTTARAASSALVRGRLIPAWKARVALARIVPTRSLKTACEGADLLIEAVSEDMALKRRLFREFDRLCPGHAVLASNTSGLSITRIAEVTKRPQRVAGMHFWNPPHIMPLVEVTKGRWTSDSTARLLTAVCRRLGKRPILVRHDIPGFVGNRLQFAVLREALHLWSAGIASAEDIDAAMTAGPGLRYGLLGPLRTADLGGLDVFCAISRYLFSELSSARTPPDRMALLVRQNKLGAKTGAGFYPYTGGEKKRILGERDRVLLGFLKVLKARKGR